MDSAGAGTRLGSLLFFRASGGRLDPLRLYRVLQSSLPISGTGQAQSEQQPETRNTEELCFLLWGLDPSLTSLLAHKQPFLPLPYHSVLGTLPNPTLGAALTAASRLWESA